MCIFNIHAADEKVEALYSKVNKRNKRVQNDSPQTHNSKAVAEEPEEAARSERPECGLNTEPNEPDDHYSPPPVPCYNPNLSDEANIYEEIEATSATLRTESDGGYVPNVTIPKELLPSFSSHSNMKAIHYAAANGSKKQLKEILLQLPLSNTEGELATKVRKGVDERDGNGRTALMHAVYNSHSHCVKLLVKHGAVVNSAAKGNYPMEVFLLHKHYCFKQMVVQLCTIVLILAVQKCWLYCLV